VMGEASIPGCSSCVMLWDRVIPRGKGFSRRSNREFVQFLFIAKGSAAEIQSQLHIAKDLGYVSEREFDKLYSDIDTLSRQVSRFITYLKGAG